MKLQSTIIELLSADHESIGDVYLKDEEADRLGLYPWTRLVEIFTDRFDEHGSTFVMSVRGPMILDADQVVYFDPVVSTLEQ